MFLEDVGSEPSSVLNELGRFDVKESKFRREMERLRNSTQRDLILEVRSLLIFVGVKVVCFFQKFSSPTTNASHIMLFGPLSPSPPL